MDKSIKYGYCRVSHISQNTSRQIEELKKYCDRIVIEKESTRKERPKLNELLGKLWEGDVIIVTELSRFGRDVKELQDNISRIKDEGAHFVSIKEGIDTRKEDIMTDLLISVLGSVYQFQRDIQMQLQKEGIERARQDGKFKGKPEKFNDEHPKIKLAFRLYEEGVSVRDILKTTDISRGTLYKNLKRYNITRRNEQKIS